MVLQVKQLGLLDYTKAHARQLKLVQQRIDNPDVADIYLLLQHLPVFTLGRNGKHRHIRADKNFLKHKGIKIIRVKRGGEVTYHGPGQVLCYPIVNLRRNRLGVAEYIRLLEEIMLRVTARFNIQATRDPRNHGIWVGKKKIGSVGIAVIHGISYHGLALNVNLDLKPFDWINPCGMTGISMTSMEEVLGQPLSCTEVEHAMKEILNTTFKQPNSRNPGKQPRKKHVAKPRWLKQRLPRGGGYEKTRRLVLANGLCTVCQEARCPNQFECFGKGTATFMLMGESCTRNCRFCAVQHTGPTPLDPEEPARIAGAVAAMKLKYCVLTSVTRDDLDDGGADHFSQTIRAIHRRCPGILVEVLIPDLQGDWNALQQICQQRPAVLNHNVETVAALYPAVRPQAIYSRSLDLLKQAKILHPDIITKSGLMLGLGETRQQLNQTMSDIRNTGCDLLTMGQYLQPTPANLPVVRYVPPAEFDQTRQRALNLGFAGVASGPHVRSSYRADELYTLASKSLPLPGEAAHG